MLRNECFRVALDYLYKNGLVADQRELSEKIGVSETSISQILNNRVKKPSEATIRKLNEAFGNIFNPQYFRGQSIYLLLEDAGYYAIHPEEDLSSSQYVPYERKKEPDPNDNNNSANLIEVAAQLIKELEGLRKDVRAEREALLQERKEIAQEREEMAQERHQMMQLMQQLIQTQTPGQYIPISPKYYATAEPSEQIEKA